MNTKRVGTLILALTSLCPCKHKIVQVLTNLVEPWQVGDQRLPLLHEMVSRNNSRRERTMSLPAFTHKNFSNRLNLFNKWHWSATLISGWYGERCTTLQTSNTMSNSFHIVLTSDASRDQYPENTAADFTMQLKSQLNLS